METLTTWVCIEKRKSWPQIRNGDGESYQKFYNFLLKCESITLAREWNPLDTPDVICMLLSKLPGVARDKWVRVVTNVRRKKVKHFKGFHWFHQRRN